MSSSNPLCLSLTSHEFAYTFLSYSNLPWLPLSHHEFLYNFLSSSNHHVLLYPTMSSSTLPWIPVPHSEFLYNVLISSMPPNFTPVWISRTSHELFCTVSSASTPSLFLLATIITHPVFFYSNLYFYTPSRLPLQRHAIFYTVNTLQRFQVPLIRHDSLYLTMSSFTTFWVLLPHHEFLYNILCVYSSLRFSALTQVIIKQLEFL